MPTDLSRAFGQLSDPGTRRYVLWSILGAVAVLLALVAGLELVLTLLAETGRAWLDWIVRALGALGAVIGAWFLFPGVASLIMGFLLDGVVRAVEARHYPWLAPAREAGLAESLAAALRLGVIVVVLNIVVLPVYLIPGVNLVVWILLNGYLLGREYIETVASRRLRRADVAELRRRHRLGVLASGAIVAALLLVPGVNLVAPVVGIALMTHRFHRWWP
ncbi:MAG TPA: EI24 domain-containing protein [Geminicoccaceae bacterium]|nr:EI24 domain-containing protein [Geminicoccus sp.]HMU50636.1 EI24 domain-containing protein [Geminicoccaceae bacterium]